MNHTPTPWRLDSDRAYRVVAGVPNVDGGTVASCAGYDNASSAEANAAFIVRACNGIERLEAAALEVIADLEARNFNSRELDELRAALKLAKGDA